MKGFLIFMFLISTLFAEEAIRIPDEEVQTYHAKFYGVWVIHRYLYGSRSTQSFVMKIERFHYYHKHVVGNPQRWLGKRILIDSEKIQFPDPLKKYDRYHDSRKCSFNLDSDIYIYKNSITYILDSDFGNYGYKNALGFNSNDKYILLENFNCYETPFDKIFLINEKELVFNFGGVFFIAKKKGDY